MKNFITEIIRLRYFNKRSSSARPKSSAISLLTRSSGIEWTIETLVFSAIFRCSTESNLLMLTPQTAQRSFIKVGCEHDSYSNNWSFHFVIVVVVACHYLHQSGFHDYDDNINQLAK
ncbi:hypothetical protein DERF_003474 [Dermatophagoides farinae]|uniref:Uncharacterized protein n=1 Tax=Dermatophagoides farinae TaxID=6954 RepID=A0A922ICN8_DERFA|nr:hypothetical protein DERF_003474 [Dermatophagoides farinae]